MTLAADLARARSEEDVKDAYIKALGLRSVFKGLVDIQTDKIWFEAKEAATPPLVMFAQLLVYVRGARKRGEPIPAFLGVVDREKAALLEAVLDNVEPGAIVSTNELMSYSLLTRDDYHHRTVSHGKKKWSRLITATTRNTRSTA